MIWINRREWLRALKNVRPLGYLLAVLERDPRMLLNRCKNFPHGLRHPGRNRKIVAFSLAVVDDLAVLPRAAGAKANLLDPFGQRLDAAFRKFKRLGRGTRIARPKQI